MESKYNLTKVETKQVLSKFMKIMGIILRIMKQKMLEVILFKKYNT